MRHESPMNLLDLKVPPPIVAAICAAAAWGLSLFTPLLQVPAVARIAVALVLALVGVGFMIAGLVSFRRAKTTVNPMKPESSTSLVSLGIYSITRNPMYVGLLFVLAALATYLSAPWSFLGPLLFFLYIGRYQVAPEERVLSKLFGAEYSNYQARVRRWL